MNNPDISIIITNYNYHEFLPRCIRSCLDQKNVNFEIILIDDGSTNSNLLNYIEPYMNKLVLIKNEKNLGTPRTSMKAIRKSKGIIFVYSDNLVPKPPASMITFIFKNLLLNRSIF